MEDNSSQGVERRYGSNGAFTLYCMVCALEFAKYAKKKPEVVINARITIHNHSKAHTLKVKRINKPNK